MTDVFVSYVNADRSIASSIVEALESQKWRVFWDRSIPAGKKWPDVLRQRLSNAKCVVVLLTRASLKSSWVTYEASVALQRRTLVPLLVDPDINPNRDLPEMYRDIHVVSIPPDRGLPRSTGFQEPWIKATRDLVRQGTVRHSLLVAGTVLLALFVFLAAFYGAVTLHNSIVEWQTGIRYVERGPFSKAENERLKGAIRGASSIDLLAVNASSLTSAFREDFAIFLKNPSHHMRVLFASPESDFYQEMMLITTKGIGKNAKAIAGDKLRLETSRQAIIGESGTSVQFRLYNTQFRMPLILVDRKYCFVTVRLTPDQAAESIRLELAKVSAGAPAEQIIARALRSLSFLFSPSSEVNPGEESCEHHFDEIWKYSKPFD
jgi:TIR domain